VWHGAYIAALDARRQRGNRIAADQSFGMLTSIEAAPTVQADAQQLSFADGSFDVVLAAHMLYHVPDIVTAARECRRVLRPGGRLVAVTNDAANIMELKALVEEAVGGGWKVVMPHDECFGMHNGAEWLTEAFDEVRTIDAPVSYVVVDDAEAVAAYVASMDSFYQPQIDLAWSVVVGRVRAQARSIIEQEGSLRLTNALGVFICSDRSSGSRSPS